MVAASSPKVAAVEAVRQLQATWIILDRQMKKDKKYFLERLSCGISRMKRNNNIELLRGPKAARSDDIVTDERQGSKVECERLPAPRRETEIQGIAEDSPEDDDLFSLELSPMTSKSFYENSRIETRTASSGSPPMSVEWQSTANRLSSSNGKNPEIPSFNKEKQSSRLQGEGNLATTQSAKNRGYMPYFLSDRQVMDCSKTVENTELAQYMNISEEASRSESAILKEPCKNSVCAYCENGKTNIGWRKFTYAELQAATEEFSKENFLSEGGFGPVYKGKLENRCWVAVKQHKDASLQGEKEFISEVHVLSKARHKNVVRLLGSCSEGSHRLLVYEFICNGSLDKHLSESSSKVLSWRERIKIALGAAKGLNYLHQNNIIHRDVTPNNILVTHAYEALIGDFGLAMAKHDVTDHSELNILGAFGYLAPEYAESGKATTKTDVYSFGVVLLELITGQHLSKTLYGESLVGWAKPLLRERRYPELIDEKIQDSYDVHQLFWMVSIAEGCLSKDPNKRPTMKQVEDALQSIIDKKTVSDLEDYSFTRSSFSSTPRSNESFSEQEKTTLETLISENSLNNQMIDTNRAFSTPSSAESPSRGLLSPYLNTNNSGLRSETTCKKSRGRSRITQQVSYDEMLS